MAGARTEDGKILIVGPDGMAVEGPPRDRTTTTTTTSHDR